MSKTCNNRYLARAAILLVAIGGCGSSKPPGPALPLDRIEIVGASVSAGFGGTPFGEAFSAAAKQSKVESQADVMMFRDPEGNSKAQIERAIAFKPTVIVALDFLFWDIYGPPRRYRDAALDQGLADLERARAAGAWIILGDVPRITTAAEWMLSASQVPAVDDLAKLNAKIVAWATGRERVLLVPLVEWTEPLRAGGNVELAPGENVAARDLMALDGLHANALGTWYLLDKLDRFIESKLPGTPKQALVFVRPKP